MKIGIFYHKKKVPEERVLSLEAALVASGAFVRIFSDAEAIGEVDRLIVLGGDGAMLRAARRASLLGIPLFGINYGTIGFLTAFERGEEGEAVALALHASCDQEDRTMLEATVHGETCHCLNEIVFMRRIARGAEDGVIHIVVNIDDRSAGEFAADGLILATPTGSTAYSLSAGGSILTPGCGAFLLTPVNAFSLRSRPIVISDKSELSFTFPDGAIVHGDGEFLGELHRGEKLCVKKSARHATFLVKEKEDFFRHLTEKIN